MCHKQLDIFVDDNTENNKKNIFLLFLLLPYISKFFEHVSFFALINYLRMQKREENESYKNISGFYLKPTCCISSSTLKIHSSIFFFILEKRARKVCSYRFCTKFTYIHTSSEQSLIQNQTYTILDSM